MAVSMRFMTTMEMGINTRLRKTVMITLIMLMLMWVLNEWQDPSMHPKIARSSTKETQ